MRENEQPEDKSVSEADEQANGLDRTIPEGIRVAEGVEMHSDDPAAVDGRRLCVAVTKAGPRCSAPALGGGILCSAHAGRLDASAGGKARASQLRLAAEEQADRRAFAALGTRAVVAAAIAERHDDLRLVVHGLIDQARDGDRQCALALLPYLNQALGMPTQTSSVEVGAAGGGDEVDLKALNTAQLLALRASMRSAHTPDTPPEASTKAS